uniref:UNC93-like protein MFSD11 n=1 Tax=Timema bartmani TaxID=61472 RepID=A0A7R9EYP5_9NEOP|nr:unnamed protein product [Timema bartmani]
MESGKTFMGEKLCTPHRDQNPDLPIIASPVYCESNALDRSTTDVGCFASSVVVLARKSAAIAAPARSTSRSRNMHFALSMDLNIDDPWTRDVSANYYASRGSKPIKRQYTQQTEDILHSRSELLSERKLCWTASTRTTPRSSGMDTPSLAVIYAVFAVCNWLAPSIISLTGPKVAMLVGAVTYAWVLSLEPSLQVPGQLLGLPDSSVVWTLSSSWDLLTLVVVWTLSPHVIPQSVSITTVVPVVPQQCCSAPKNYQLTKRPHLVPRLFIVSFLFPKTWLLYLASCVIGFGAAIIWTGQGNYLTLNSDSETISRNSGVFWAMLQASMFFGNLFVYFKFQGKTHIDHDTRLVVFIVLIVLAAIGIVFLLLLRPAQNADGERSQSDWLIALLTVEGIELSFFSGVYSPSIGFTLQMGSNAKQLVGLSGIFIGVGEVVGKYQSVHSDVRRELITDGSENMICGAAQAVERMVGVGTVQVWRKDATAEHRVSQNCQTNLTPCLCPTGGALFGILGQKTIRWGRDPIVMIGFVVHILSFFLIFINLPDAAPFGDTNGLAFISSNQYLAMLCSLLLGFGDSCYNTQIYSILGGIFPEDSAPAFALFKFTQSIAAAASFFYSSHIGLHAQLGILIVFATLGTLTFCWVEWMSRAKKTIGFNGTIDDPAYVDSSRAVID